jgi:hypothetical protein
MNVAQALDVRQGLQPIGEQVNIWYSSKWNKNRADQKLLDNVGGVWVALFRHRKLEFFDSFHDKIVSGGSKWVRAEEVEIQADPDGPHVRPECH